MPTLVLLRHAKSAWPPGVPDDQRPLNVRGRRDAPAAGAVLAARAPIDLALVSPAARARETYALVAAEMADAPPPTYDERIYEADPADLLDVLAEVPAGTPRVLLVGHNPGLEMLALRLSSPHETPDFLQMVAKFPTSGIAEIELAGDWSELSTSVGQGDLVSFAVPRG
ncbi:MAG: SixA phosphatase family protein [Candidatus Nanopelagicales bacterium]